MSPCRPTASVVGNPLANGEDVEGGTKGTTRRDNGASAEDKSLLTAGSIEGGETTRIGTGESTAMETNDLAKGSADRLSSFSELRLEVGDSERGKPLNLQCGVGIDERLVLRIAVCLDRHARVIRRRGRS